MTFKENEIYDLESYLGVDKSDHNLEDQIDNLVNEIKLLIDKENHKKDFDSDMDTRDIYYDTGYMVSLCVAIGKVELGQKLHDKFLLH